MLAGVSYPDYTGWLKHDLVKASSKTYSGEIGAARTNQDMKRTKLIALKFSR